MHHPHGMGDSAGNAVASAHHAAPARRPTPPPLLRRTGSNGSFASARDSKFWLAVASKSSASSASSSASSLSGSFLHNSLLHKCSSLDLLLCECSDTANDRGASPGKSGFDLGLVIDVEDVEADDDDDDEEEEQGKHRARETSATQRLAPPITSPPSLSAGIYRPTTLQRHRTRDRLSSDWRPSVAGSTTSRGSESSVNAESAVRPLPTPCQLNKSPPVIVKPEPLMTELEMEVAIEEVYEHQRYQLVLGWGSKGHLMPMDPGKYVRVVRSPQQPSRRAEQRRPSLSRDNSVQATSSPTFPDVPLPDAPSDDAKWEWISPWHLEDPLKTSKSVISMDEMSIDGEQSLDADGWIYASGFSQFTSWRADSASSMQSLGQADDVCVSPMVNARGRPKYNVRRRKWIRYRRLRPVAGSLNGLYLDHPTASPFDDTFLDSMCGWLRKLGHVRKNWKMRYFVLEKSVLRYYTDEAMTRLKGEVLLFHPAAQVHYVDIHLSNGRDNTFAIQVGPDYTLLLEADRVSDRENWMYCIEDALLCRDSYLQDPTRTQDVRESVSRRRNFSSETILYSTSGDASSSSGINPINMLMLHSKAVVQATRKNPLMMRLMVECDWCLESKHIKQQIAAFIHKFKQKYGGAVVNSSGINCAPLSKSTSPLATIQGNRRRTASYEGANTRSSDVSVVQDPRSVLALKNYRFFLERAMTEIMDHLMTLPLANATCLITSPRNSGPTSGLSRDFNGDARSIESPPISDEIDWELAKKAALYKLERQTFVPLQSVIYGLLEATVDIDDLSRFEWNRHYLAKQSQQFFEIQDSQISPSEWKSARTLLDSMDNYSLPTEKASILLEVAKCIYDTYASEHAVDVQMMAADDFLPIFIFILARSKLRNVVVARHLISETMISGVMIGETGYYATMFEAAVSYIASFFTPEESDDRLSRLTIG